MRVIAETFGSLPLHVYRKTKNGREKAVDHPIYKLIHDQPNQYMTSAVYRETASAQLSTAGITTATSARVVLVPSSYSLYHRDRPGP